MSGGPNRWAMVAAFSAAIGLAILTVAAGASGNLLAASILQAVTLVYGVIVSYLFGKVSAKEAAADVVRPQARSAFRRQLRVFEGHGRVLAAIQAEQAHLDNQKSASKKTVGIERVELVLQRLYAQVAEQINSSGDAMEDWRDLVPDEVSEVERLVKERNA